MSHEMTVIAVEEAQRLAAEKADNSAEERRMKLQNGLSCVMAYERKIGRTLSEAEVDFIEWVFKFGWDAAREYFGER